MAGVVGACLGCPVVRQVMVVDDGLADATADLAAAAGAKVISTGGDAGGATAVGSKGHAMAAGLAASDADALLFVDADLLGLSGRHLEEICEPFLSGRATMSLGLFDYGLWNPLVLRLPPTTGERVVPRRVLESVPPERWEGYTIETAINDVIAERHLATVARTMDGVTQRSKRQKFGLIDGSRRSWRMFRDLIHAPLSGDVRWRTYAFYLGGLTVESPAQ